MKLRPSSSRRPDPGRALVVGYFGFSNLGDELILADAVRRLRASGFRVSVLSGPRLSVSAPSVSAVPRWNLFALLGLLLSRNLFVVVPGGEVFQSRTSRRSLLYYTSLCGLFRYFGHRLFLLFQGIDGGSLVRADRTRVASLFAAAAAASFRDRRPSLPGLHGLPVLGDPVWSMRLPRARPRRTTALFVLKETASGSGWETAVAGIVRTVLGSSASATVRFAVFHPDDKAVTGRVAKLAGGDADARIAIVQPGITEAGPLVADSGFVLAMRYHAVVLAGLSGARCFCLTDQEKLLELCRTTGVPRTDLRSRASVRLLASNALRTYRRTPGLRPGLDPIRKRIERHWAHVIGLMRWNRSAVLQSPDGAGRNR